ncbi:MAG: DEAD/DEAH box helicase [Angelakisella sp.]
MAWYGFGGILADDMGLGKTLQVLALLLAQKEEETEHTLSLVACPSSLVLNWESEVSKFAPTLCAIPIVGTAPEREALLAEHGATADLLITSYDLLKRDVALYTNYSFRYVVADEAQYMKNQNTQNAKAVKTLHAGVRLALTGTPVENSLAELWSIFDFLMPGYLYHYSKFRSMFETPIVKQGDEAAAKRLHAMVSPFILRRMKSDVLKELPDKIETVLTAELDGEQKKVYLAAALAAKQALDAGLGENGSDKIQILAMITRLRQLCCDPALVYENYNQGSAKLELCLELVQSCMESGHRVLLFSQFTSMLARIADRLDAMDIDYLTITGQTAVGGRLELVNSFNEGTVPVFLISLKAGGTGLNLTGADVVIHYDPWWNSSAQNQATDRAHRIGQTKTVQVYKLIVKGTIEERILAMQRAKMELADLVVKEGDGAFARMTKEEILTLFE